MGAREEVGMRAVLSVRAACVLLLIAGLFCYNLDFECLLETPAQQVQSGHAELDTPCSQPSALPAVVAILPPRTSFGRPAPVVVELVRRPWTEPDLARLRLEAVPLGLRAPPLS